MTDFKQQYKNKGFGDTEQQRILRAYKWDKSRKEIRSQTFDRNRRLLNISPSTTPQTEDSDVVDNERMRKLIKWRLERDKRKKLERAKKKPVFKVGIVHHALYSPVSKSDIMTPSKVKSPRKPTIEVVKRITRATQKRLLAKATATTSKLMTPATKKVVSNPKKHLAINKATPTKQQESFAPVDHKFRPPSGLPNMPLFGFVTMDPTPSEKGDFFIQNKLTDGNIFDTNNQKNILARKSPQLSDTNRNLSEINKFVYPKLSSSERKLSQLNERMSHLNEDTSKSVSPKLPQNKRKSSRLNGKNLNSDDDVSEINKSLKKQKYRQKLSEQTSPSDNNTSKSNQFMSSISSDESQPDETELINQTYELNKDTNSKLLNQEAILNSSQKENLSSNIDMRTPSQSNVPKSSVNENLIVFSPYLTLSRGKSNARKEQQIRLGIGRSSEGIPTKDTVMHNLNISIEDEERTAQYFKFLLNKETDRLQNLCDSWLKIQAEKDIPEDAIYEISQAIGQTKLLINKKFQRFCSLVTDCETGRGEMLVTCRDLQGFWDMTYMEVKNCDLRFEKLEQRRNKGWEEEQCTIIKPVNKKRMPAKKQIVSEKPSSLRSLILAAKKRKIVKPQDKEDLLQVTDINKEHITPVLTNRRSLIHNINSAHKTRRSKSLFPTEHKSTPTRYSGSGVNLLRKVLSSEKSERLTSPFTVMKISQMCKTPEVQLDNTISYVNSDQTPGKSILKRSEELVKKEARIKSTCKVNFDDHIVLNEVPVTEALETKLSLSAALSKIDSLNMDELSPEECINAGKKLNFDIDESDSDNFGLTSEIKNRFKLKKNKSESSIQNISSFVSAPFNDITYTTLFKETSPTGDLETTSSKKSLKHIQHKNINVKTTDTGISPTILSSNIDAHLNSETASNATNMEIENDFGVRSLRNRIITRNDTPKINRTSKNTPKIRDSSKKENKSPMTSKRKSSLKYTKEDKIKHLICSDNESNQIETDESTHKRRKSSRKSVAFTAESCLACAENKPVLPMTPHSKRRSKVSRQSRDKHALDEDFMSCPETPERPPSRVRRSRVKN